MTTAIQKALEILNREKGELRAEIERLTAERDNILKAVLHHFGPEGANKVCTSVLDGRALEPKP